MSDKQTDINAFFEQLYTYGPAQNAPDYVPPAEPFTRPVDRDTRPH
jgi:hypothetical protein